MYVRLGRYPDDEKERDEDVVIHPYDTWNMDHTLAIIIVPLLKQLKATKHSAPNVDNEDVPIPLRAPEQDVLKYKVGGETDDQFFERWDWVMDEMIWTFEQIKDDSNEEEFFNQSEKQKVDMIGLRKYNERIDNGLRLFGKYYRSLWD